MKVWYYLELVDDEGVGNKDSVVTSEQVIVFGEDNVEHKGARKRVWRNHMVKVGQVVKFGFDIARGCRDDGIGSAHVLYNE